jgi:acetyl esterase/lipase
MDGTGGTEDGMKRSTGFLVASATGAAATANALRPYTRSGKLSLASFTFGLPTSELPLQALILQAIGAAVLARKGGYRGLAGTVGVAATAGSWAGLVRLHREAGRAADVLEAALTDQLGPDYRSQIRSGFSPAPEVPLTRRQILLPDWTTRRQYRAERDISYGEFGRRNLLDVWRRRDIGADARAPVLVQVHGGAWVGGRKEGQGEPLMGHLAQRGWVCAAPNYRLSPRATWPDHIVDVKRALAWVKANIGDHGGDPDFVVITGGSAGGHLAALAALTPHRAEWQPGFETADTSVAAAVPLYGVYDFINHTGTTRADTTALLEKRVLKTAPTEDLARWKEASPICHLGPEAPPFFVLHGTNDSVVPVEQARRFVAECRRVSRQAVVYAELPLAQHAFDTLPSVRAHHTALAIERFLAVVRTEHGGPVAPAVTAG